tara:strand:- start:3092 stop:3457 length:366 start_codon:yes stop_codon:yes gene_type:complete
MKTEEWTMDKNVENVVFRQSWYNNKLTTLKEIYKVFKGLIKKCEFSHPPVAILKEYTNEEGVRVYIFEYKCIMSDGDVRKDMLVAKTPDNPSTNWSIHQVLSIMQDMYILKLNEQILTKHK